MDGPPAPDFGVLERKVRFKFTVFPVVFGTPLYSVVIEAGVVASVELLLTRCVLKQILELQDEVAHWKARAENSEAATKRESEAAVLSESRRNVRTPAAHTQRLVLPTYLV